MRREIWGTCVQLASRIAYRQSSYSAHPRVLHLHVRKSAGTSFNLGFLRQLTADAEGIYEMTARKLIKCSQTREGLYCAWDPALAAAGRYVFCHTHTPAWEFDVPDNVFVVTILRDPLARLSSLHAMLRLLAPQSAKSRILRKECQRYRDDIVAFVRDLPEEELLGQVYKFSKNLDLNEALRNLRAEVDLVGSTDEYAAFITKFNAMTGYAIPVLHLRKGRKDYVSYEDLPEQLARKLTIERNFVAAAIKQAPDQN